SSRRRHTRFSRDWSSDVCSSDLELTDPDDRTNGGNAERDEVAGVVAEVPDEREHELHRSWAEEQVRPQAAHQETDHDAHGACNQIGRASCRARAWISGVAGCGAE